MYPSRRSHTESCFRHLLSVASTSRHLRRKIRRTSHPTYLHSSLPQCHAYITQRHEYGNLQQQQRRNVTSDVADVASSIVTSESIEENDKISATTNTSTPKLKGPDVVSALTTASLFPTQQPKLYKNINLPLHTMPRSQVQTDSTDIPLPATTGSSNATTQKSSIDCANAHLEERTSDIHGHSQSIDTKTLTDTRPTNTSTIDVAMAHPQKIQQKLNQVQREPPVQQNDERKSQPAEHSIETTEIASSLRSENPLNSLKGTSEPDLPPLMAPTNMQYTTIDEILSLPLSAWDDEVWDQGRWIFVQRFQSHCSFLVQTERSWQPSDANPAPSPLSSSHKDKTDVLTINEMQETLNLLQRLCQARSDTIQLQSLMTHFFAEVRVVMEMQKHLKVSNKQLRNDYQYHPSFGLTGTPPDIRDPLDVHSMKQEKYSTMKDDVRNHFKSLSLGTVAHLIEVTIYQIMKNRYWYPNTTTAYQTMIQVAAIATVDHKIYSTSSAIHHNPGANAEYWLKQQHQASRMQSQLSPLHNASAYSLHINAPNRYDYTTVLEGWLATCKIEQQYQNFYNPYDVSQHPAVTPIPIYDGSRYSTASESPSSEASSPLPNDNSNRSTAASRAGQLIRQWQFLYSSSENNPVLKPTEAAYSNWLLCIVHGGSHTAKGAAINAARECHDALREISKRSEKDNFWPSVTLYNILMNAYSKAGDAEAAEAVLHDLIEKAKYNTYCIPDVVSFTTVINAWAQIPHNQAAPDRAERLFHLQQDFATRSGLESLLPTATTVTAVLQCWVKSNHPLAPSRAEAILKQMHDMVRAGYPKLQPNVITYNICMNIWCRSGHFDASNKVEELFQELVEQYRASNYAVHFKPDIATYLARILAWERNRTLTANTIAEKVESIYNELISPIDLTSTKEGIGSIDAFRKPRPNQAIYNILIRAFSNCGDALAATKYLEAMISDYVDNKNYKAIPNRYVFHFVISAWSKKLSYSGAETAEWWLNRMHHLSISHPALKVIAPNSISYNTCLGAWARFPQGRMIIDTDPNIEVALYEMNDGTNDVTHHKTNQSQSLQSSTMTKCPTVIAMERGQHLFRRMKQNNIRPDVYTYGSLLHIISNQKQCTKHVKYTQAQSIIEKMVRDNIEMNAYIFTLLKKCGIRNLPNYNIKYNQRGSTIKEKSAVDEQSTDEMTNPSKPSHQGPQLPVRSADTNDMTESL